MIIDYLAGVGHFAFRNVPDSDPSDLLKRMDREGIDMAVVSSLECVMYRNVQAGNELLAERLKGRGDRFVGAAVVNPDYAGAADDARVCLGEMGMKALRLVPGYHGYGLGEAPDSPDFRAVMSVAEEFNAPVSIAFIVEDPRQRHILVNPPPVRVADAARVIRAFPKVRFVMERATRYEMTELHALAGDASNWFVETSGKFLTVTPADAPESYRHRGLPDIVDLLGVDRVLFGSDMPLQYPRAALMKIRAARLDDARLNQILSGNARKLLGL